jgi:hypothetical protein
MMKAHSQSLFLFESWVLNSREAARKMRGKKDQHQRQVEAAEHRRVGLREGRKKSTTACEEPDLASIPERTYRFKQGLLVFFFVS